MPIAVETLSNPQLENLVENHRRRAATDAALYIDALRELGTRKGKGLEFDKSLSIILPAAAKGEFLSYKELANASSSNWNHVRFAMNQHLWDLVEYSHRKHGVLFSAIVVNTANVPTGRMEPETLRGFVGAARLLGYTVTNEQAFLKDQQKRVFTWAQNEANSMQE